MPLSGSIDARGHPRVEVVLRGPFGHDRVDGIVDTGFTRAVSVPEEWVTRLGLRRRTIRPTRLADGTLRTVQVYHIEIEWVTGPTLAEALESSLPDLLIGAGLLRGHQLVVDYGAAQSIEIR